VTYYNYLGQPMPESVKDQANVTGTTAGNETIYAPAGPSAVSGGGGGDLLVGNSSDNWFYITDPKDQVIEQPNGGVDTEVGWLSLKLAPNVENLIVHGDFNSAVGNNLDNLIVVDGNQWVYGGLGNDVLVGSATQRTTFLEKAGEGNDVIYNWNGNSQLQLLGYGFTTPAQIEAAMVQKGADVVLNEPNGESLTFRATTLSSFAARQFLLPLDTSKLGAMTFDDEFNTLSVYNASTQSGTWQTNFGGNLKDQWAYSLVSNGEQQVYVAPGFQGRGEADLGINPFSISNGVLTITASPIPSDQVYAAFGHTYASGMLNTLGSFQQKYGYFEMRAAIPSAAGTWPAFWMLPHPYQPNMEADIMEGLGAAPNVDFRRGYGGTETQYDNALKLDPTGFHTYGMLWTAQTITFYYDGTAVLTGPTPSTWTSPMALIVNMAVGGWGGTPDTTKFPAQMQIDYVRAYALADGSSQVVHTTPDAPVDTLRESGGATSGQTPVAVNFDANGAPVTSAHIQVFPSKPATLPAGKTFVIWEDSGAVFGAVSDGATLAPATALMAGTAKQFTGDGAWLTDGKVAFSYLQANAAGGTDAWAMVFDPAKNTFTRQDLGAATGNLHFVATYAGGFVVSWHAPDGTIEARGYDEYAYGGTVPGWYGPTHQVAGDLSGINAQHQIIATSATGAQQLYDILGASVIAATGGTPSAAVDFTIYAILRTDSSAPSVAAMASDLKTQLTNGTITAATMAANVAHAAGATSSVATLSYEFFTGKVPTVGGMDYLVAPTGSNPNNLNSAYYQSFSLENRYINFAVNLGKFGEGQAAFAATYGGVDLYAATQQAYTKIFGAAPTDAKVHALLDAVLTFIGQTMTRADYFAYYGQDGHNGLGSKAAMVGWLLAEAEKADVGTYAHANDAFFSDLALHNAPYAVDIVGTYATPSDVYAGP
jgi:beta-glucanase (GH16 family)